MMFNFNQSKRILAIAGCAVAGLLSFNSAYALNPETVTAEVAFVAPITIVTTNNLQYGALNVLMGVGDTVIIAPGGGVLDSGPNILGGTQAPAAMTVGATALQAINILVDTPTNGGGAYNLSGFQCDYAGGGAAACDAGGLNTTSALSAPLLLGATLTGTGGAVAGTFNGSVVVTITYF
jgi:hypothetical protein